MLQGSSRKRVSGVVLFILAAATSLVVGVQSPAHAPQKDPDASQVPSTVHHRAGQHETLWDVAAHYQVDPRKLADANRDHLVRSRDFRPAAELTIPGIAPAENTQEGARQRARATADRLELGGVAVANRLYRARARSDWAEAAGPPDAWQGTLRWPVEEGRWVRGFGSGAGDYHLAVDISADVGNLVRAAAPGIVAYAGSHIDGYGKLVFLVHPGGMATMYAHNSKLTVSAGQRVTEGQIIAEVGSTGISRGPHVHFELLHDGKLCDPRALFRPGIRKAPGGDLVRPKQASAWKPTEGPPEATRCDDRRDYPG